MAGVRIRSTNTRRGSRRGNKTRIRSPRIFIFILFLIFGFFLLLSYIPDRTRADSYTGDAALVLERYVTGIDEYELIKSDEEGFTERLDGAGKNAILLVNLSENLRRDRLEELLRQNRQVILTGVSTLSPSEIAGILDHYQIYTGYYEFDETEFFIREIMENRKYSSLVFRAHKIKSKEYPNYDLESATLRYVRAVRERSVDALVFVYGQSEHFEYEELVENVYTKLKEEGLYSDTIRSVSYNKPSSPTLAVITGFLAIASFNIFLAFGYLIILAISGWLSLTYLVVIGEVALFFTLMRISRRKGKGKELLVLFLFFISAVILGIAVNTQMVSPAYQNGIELFRGVKLSLFVLPVFIFGLGLMRRRSKEFTLFDIIMVVIFIIGIIYYLLRSGNFSLVLNFERQLRDMLDSLLLVRPRFKELIGYPFLLVAIVQGFRNFGRFGALIPAVGSIAFVSVINTFCHATPPLWTQLLRSLYGIIFGTIIALIALFIIKFSKEYALIKETTSSEKVSSDSNQKREKRSK
ncbi:MAG: DUF5693 family protein [Kosmotogaceae bacterium]